MSEEGFAAGMVTGEERVLPEGATHIARTIETLDLHRVVDVCVIDEVQMLGDPSRGWAWTQAMIGAPAQLVVLTGAPEAIPLVEHLLAMTGEPLEVKILKRKGRLRVEGVPANLNKLIARRCGRGLHPPRRARPAHAPGCGGAHGRHGLRSARARGAPGRGRALPQRRGRDPGRDGCHRHGAEHRAAAAGRVLDPAQVRRRARAPAQAMEIKQIAGRAGRFGHHDEGLVTALPEVGAYAQVETVIRNALNGDAAKLRGKAYVRPNQETVLSASEVLQTDRLGRVLRHLYDTLVAGHPGSAHGRHGGDDRAWRRCSTRSTCRSSTVCPMRWRRSTGARSWPSNCSSTGPGSMPAIGRVQAPDFGVNTDLLKLEARVKIATSWLWLAQRYPDVFEDVEAVVDLRASLNAKIEEKLVATSVSHRRKPDEKSRRDRGKKPQRQKKNRRDRVEADTGEAESYRVRGR